MENGTVPNSKNYDSSFQLIVVEVGPLPKTFSCKERHVLHPIIPSTTSPN